MCTDLRLCVSHGIHQCVEHCLLAAPHKCIEFVHDKNDRFVCAVCVGGWWSITTLTSQQVCAGDHQRAAVPVQLCHEFLDKEDVAVKGCVFDKVKAKDPVEGECQQPWERSFVSYMHSWRDMSRHMLRSSACMRPDRRTTATDGSAGLVLWASQMRWRARSTAWHYLMVGVS